MYLENCLTAFEIRKFDWDSSVKTSRTGQGGIKGFRAVGCRQNDHSIVSLKAIHLCKKLVQCLFSFIIAACHLSVSFLTDGIDLINKYDTWCFLFCLFKKIADFGCAHTDKHFHEFGA